MKSLLFSSLTLGLALFLSPAPAVQAIDFQTEVRPILQKRCGKCHNGPRAKGGFRIDNNKYLIKRINTEEDAVFHPGHPEKSLAVKKASLPRSDTDAMPPPTRGDPLTTIELATIKKWITEGAKLESTVDDGDGNNTPTAPTTPTEVTFHEWSNTQGATLKAAFVKLEGKTVTLKKEDGSTFDYPMSSLAPVSRTLATKLASGQ
ncbi:MAG: hypothetical protein HKN23_14775 [Verrucomicrobiales bacterium]|nr:hypothetical protein [Verrucomicrobiales bacterium]